MSNPTPSPSGGSKTPRTDAVEAGPYPNRAMPHLARDIEAELGELKTEIARMRCEALSNDRRVDTIQQRDTDDLVTELTDARATIQSLTRERDEMKLNAESWERQWDRMVKESADYCAERDALQQKLADATSDQAKWERMYYTIREDRDDFRDKRDDLAALVKVKDAALRAVDSEFDCPCRNTNLGLPYASAVTVSQQTRQQVKAALSPVTTTHVDSSAAPQPASDSDAPSA